MKPKCIKNAPSDWKFAVFSGKITGKSMFFLIFYCFKFLVNMVMVQKVV